MVYNSTRVVQLPHHGSSTYRAITATSKNGMKHLSGTGMGSVVLRPGGGGAASSYMDMDDYISTTNINPYTRAGVSQGKGIGSQITSKLSKLNIAPPTQSLRKNIVMSM